MISRRRSLCGIIAAGLLLGVAAAARAEPVTVTFLHCNDVYEIAPVNGQGGFAPFMTLLRQERARNPNSVTTFGGDLISPSILSGLTKGEQMVELMGDVGVQLAVPGNHEYDFGPAIAEERFKASRFRWLGTNILGPDGKAMPGLGDLTVVEVGGVKLGFMGLLTPETEHLSSPGPDVRFADPATTAEAAASRLRGMGADLVVALTHLDFAEDRALAAKVKGIDIVLGGHDHDPMTIYEGGKLIVKAGSDLHYLAAVDVTVDRVKGKDGKESVVWRPAWRYKSTAGVAPDPEIQAVGRQVGGPARPGAGAGGGDGRGRAGHAPLDGARGGEQLRRPRGGRHAGADRRAGRDPERRHASAATAPTGRHADHAEGRHGRAAVRQRRRPARAGRQDGQGRARERRGQARGRGRALSAGLRPELHLRPAAAGGQRILDVKVGGEPLRPDATYRVPPTTTWRAAATATRC